MQTGTQSTVVAVFRNSTEAQAALGDLKAAGFSSGDVFIDNASDGGALNDTRIDDTTTHREGGITGWFKSIFGQEEHDDRPYYENAASSGHVLLSATVPDESLDRVADILERHSPVDVHREAGGNTDAFETTSDRGALNRGTAATTAASTAATDQAIPVVREDLQVGKRTVLRGGVRVYSRMVETPVEEQIQLRDEHVHVSRTPTNREATTADLRPGQEQVFEVKEYAEEPVVAKTARVVEEVRVGKDSSQRTETIRDTVRHTEVEVDNLQETGTRAGSTSPTQTGIGYAGSSTGTGLTADPASTGGLSGYDTDYRSDWQKNYGSSGGRYEEYQPAYQYGNTIANDPRYKGRSWDEIEPSLRSDYSSKYPNSTWDKMKNSVRYGWDRVTGKV